MVSEITLNQVYEYFNESYIEIMKRKKEENKDSEGKKKEENKDRVETQWQGI